MWGSRFRECQRQLRRSKKKPLKVTDCVRNTFSQLKREKSRLPDLKKEVTVLVKQIRACRGHKQIRQRMVLEERVEKLRRRIKELEMNQKASTFAFRVAPLLKHEKQQNEEDTNEVQKREALLMRLCRPRQALPVFIQKDRCMHCNVDFVLMSEESLLACPECGRVSRYMQSMTDTLDFDHQLDHQSPGTGSNQYDRPPHYRRYLMQFSDTVQDPPDKVLGVVYQELYKVHIMLPNKVKPTPVAQILRRHGLQQWCWMAVRISKLINNEPIAKLSKDLIDRLVYRFEKLQDAFMNTKKKSRKKIINFSFLTRAFLNFEGEYEQADRFEAHKTRLVLKKEDLRLEASCKQLKLGEKDGLNWTFRRSC